VGALAAGTLACAAGPGTPSVVNAQSTSNIAGFGWEINNLGVGGGAVSLPVKDSVTLKTVDVDLCFRRCRYRRNPVSPMFCAEVRCLVVALPPSLEQKLISFRQPPLS
jgi:hypothetical protein